jgi:hypothetical protein
MAYTAEQKQAMAREAKRVIARAKRHDIALEFKDFEVYNGEIYLDGMDPDEWIDAMVMD